MGEGLTFTEVCVYIAVANERTVIMKEYMNAAMTLICTP